MVTKGDQLFFIDIVKVLVDELINLLLDRKGDVIEWAWEILSEIQEEVNCGGNDFFKLVCYDVEDKVNQFDKIGWSFMGVNLQYWGKIQHLSGINLCSVENGLSQLLYRFLTGHTIPQHDFQLMAV